jgi:hypothetical protein
MKKIDPSGKGKTPEPAMKKLPAKTGTPSPVMKKVPKPASPAPRMPGKMSPDAKRAALKNWLLGQKKGNR